MKLWIILALCASAVAPSFAAEPGFKAKLALYFEENGLDDGKEAKSPKLEGAAKKKLSALTTREECKKEGFCPSVYDVKAVGTYVEVIEASVEGNESLFVYDIAGKHLLDCAQKDSGALACD